jgi:tetratricopeptide (TPR) repeat protein
MRAVLSLRPAWILLAALWGTAACSAARGNDIPSGQYYDSYLPYYLGRYTDAGKAFQDAFSLKGVNGRWVDAIPQYTMMGECYYQLGDYDRALDTYAQAMQLYLKFPDFLLRVDWTTGLRAARTPVRIPWGPAGPIERGAIIGDYTPTEKLVAGNVIANGKIVIDTRTIKAVNVQEIVRALAVAIRRYGEVLGPTAKHDPLLDKVITQLAGPMTKDRHWSQALVDVLAGIAARAGGRGGEEGLLRRGRLAGGEYEHPLTAMALLELGHIALAKGDYVTAGSEFEKATYAAMHFSDRNSPCRYGTPDILEEAFRYGFIAHRLAGHGKPFTPAKPAAEWAQKKDCPALQASLLLNAAESDAALRNPTGADGHLRTARQLIFGKVRGDMGRSRIAARLQQLEALVRYQQGRISEGDTALAGAMEFQRRASLWLYHIQLADRLAQKPPTNLSNEKRLDLYRTALRDPDANDWKLQPLESLSVLMGGTLRGLPMEHWFEAVLQSNRAAGTSAVEIADLVRRHRFGSALDLGGRMVSLRWLLESPSELLDKDAAAQRGDLLLKEYPEYDKLAKQVQRIKGELQQMPLVIDPKPDRAAAEEQSRKLAEIARLSALQEALLRQLAVDRVHSPTMFPPKRSTKEVKESLPKGQALLVFFATTATAESPSRFFVFLLTGDKEKEKDRYPSWMAAQPVASFNEATQKLLREMGHFTRDREIPAAQLRSTAWQDTAGKIFQQIFTAAPSAGAPSPIPMGIDELVIVPDSVLWYLPFEALQISGAGGKSQSLISKYRVRYAPTMSLAVPGPLGRKVGGNLAVAVGPLMPGKGGEDRARAAFDELQRVIPSAVALPPMLPERSSVYSTLFDRLVVLDDIDVSAGPLAWRPLRPKLKPEATASPLAGWLELPWGGPDQVILPGFHTPAEHGLSDKEKNPAGMDVFLSTCGMMASGSRTILLSRWRTGGKTSFDLVREFAQELPQTTAAHAWQRSVLLCSEAPLVPDQEPRVSVSPGGGAISGSHPFFWSGYLLVDTGVRPPGEDTNPAPKAAVRAANFR